MYILGMSPTPFVAIETFVWVGKVDKTSKKTTFCTKLARIWALLTQRWTIFNNKQAARLYSLQLEPYLFNQQVQQCPPSHAHLTFGVSVYSVKDSLEAAQGSVKRRIDYIVQVLRNNGLKEKDYKCSIDISRRGECVRVQTDVLIDFDGVSKCETVRNLLIEKLDASSVQITAITCQHLFEDKEEKRYVL